MAKLQPRPRQKLRIHRRQEQRKYPANLRDPSKVPSPFVSCRHRSHVNIIAGVSSFTADGTGTADTRQETSEEETAPLAPPCTGNTLRRCCQQHDGSSQCRCFRYSIRFLRAFITQESSCRSGFCLYSLVNTSPLVWKRNSRSGNGQRCQCP